MTYRGSSAMTLGSPQSLYQCAIVTTFWIAHIGMVINPLRFGNPKRIRILEWMTIPNIFTIYNWPWHLNALNRKGSGCRIWSWGEMGRHSSRPEIKNCQGWTAWHEGLRWSVSWATWTGWGNVFDLIFVGKNPWVNLLQMANLDGKSMVNPENGEPQIWDIYGSTDGAHCKGNGKGATWPMFWTSQMLGFALNTWRMISRKRCPWMPWVVVNICWNPWTRMRRRKLARRGNVDSGLYRSS